jgi:hypothetical protein
VAGGISVADGLTDPVAEEPGPVAVLVGVKVATQLGNGVIEGKNHGVGVTVATDGSSDVPIRIGTRTGTDE